MKDLAVLASSLNDVSSNPAERTFAGYVAISYAHAFLIPHSRRLKRGPDGTFSDDALAEILHMAIESPAGAFRGRGTPTVLRLVEIMGIEQSRAWGLCTMNEFRKFLGLRGGHSSSVSCFPY